MLPIPGSSTEDCHEPPAGQTIAVLGGHGFVGSHLVQSLVDESASVRVLCGRVADGSLGCLEYIDPAVRGNLDLHVGTATDRDLVSHVMPLSPLGGIDDELAAPNPPRRLPDWRPRVSFDEGLRRTADWLVPDRSSGVSWSA